MRGTPVNPGACVVGSLVFDSDRKDSLDVATPEALLLGLQAALPHTSKAMKLAAKRRGKLVMDSVVLIGHARKTPTTLPPGKLQAFIRA